NKLVGTSNCISWEVVSQTAGFLLRPIGRLYLQGRAEGVNAYEALIDTAENRARSEEYTKAHALAAAGDGSAPREFQLLAQRYPQDRLILFHLSRLAGRNIGVDIHLAGK